MHLDVGNTLPQLTSVKRQKARRMVQLARESGRGPRQTSCRSFSNRPAGAQPQQQNRDLRHATVIGTRKKSPQPSAPELQKRCALFGGGRQIPERGGQPADESG